jgi:N-carbamoylputrescine amidase
MTFTVALVQQEIPAELDRAIERGLEALERAAEQGARLVVFPELSFVPFFPQFHCGTGPAVEGQTLEGRIVTTFREAAARLGVVVVINLYERFEGKSFDTSPVIDADGSLLGKTQMVHITEYEHFHEQGYYAPGDTLAPVYQTAVGSIGVAICYDRHYPEYMRSLALGGADLVVVPQAGVYGEWPDGLFEAEMRVAAFHNGYFVALANRVGREKNLEFCGGSMVADPYGQMIAQAPYGRETLLFAEIDTSACAHSPARTLFLRDRRPEVYESGAVRLTRDSSH